MAIVLEMLILFIEPASLAILLVYAFGFLSRSTHSVHMVNAAMGCVFGLACVVAMSFPIELADGIIVDVRALFVGVSAAFFGVIGGLLTLAIGLTTRMVIAGDGASLGLLSMTVSSMMGFAWTRLVRPRMQERTDAYAILALMISTDMTVALLLPEEIRTVFYTKLAPILLLANLVGTFTLALLIERERRLIHEAQSLAQAASTDQLTKLMNRSSAAKAYAALPEPKGRSQGTAMLCIDVDAFKQINDKYGHIRGDHVLVDVATRMSKCLRPTDVFSRMSGDEFLIVLPNVTTEQAHSIAERCCAAISSEPIIASGAAINVSVSIGANWSRYHVDFKVFREAADDALYHAKSLGRDCVAFVIGDQTTQSQKSLQTGPA